MINTSGVRLVEPIFHTGICHFLNCFHINGSIFFREPHKTKPQFGHILMTHSLFLP